MSGEIDDGTESVSTLSVASNNLKLNGKRKKEPPGYCEDCNKWLSRKSDVSRHWRNSCPKIQSGNNLEQKVKLIHLENNVTLYIQLKSLRGTSIKN